MEDQGDRLDSLLSDYERRQQEETRRQVQQAIRLEEDRRRGAEQLRRHALVPVRDVVERLHQAGHRVVHQELLDAYPPSVRLHLWPKPAPLDAQDPKRTTFELVWGDPDKDQLCAKRWTSEGLHSLGHMGSARRGVLDELWVREQLITFVREALEGV